MQCIYRCIWDFSCIQSGDSVHPANKHSSMTMTHPSWILCVSGSQWRREVKGLSDGNVLLWTGHGAGAGMESAPQPGKWLFPVLAAPALNKHTQTHICVHPGDKASFLCTRMSPHKAYVFCLPGKDWNRNGCPNFAPLHHKTHLTKSRGAEWVCLAEPLYQDSPAGLHPQPCSLLQPLPNAFWSAHQNLHTTQSPKTHSR